MSGHVPRDRLGDFKCQSAARRRRAAHRGGSERAADGQPPASALVGAVAGRVVGGYRARRRRAARCGADGVRRRQERGPLRAKCTVRRCSTPRSRVLRPAILWNDGRSGAECVELETREPRTRAITGNAAMAGFTAPKLLWVRKHEPDVFARTASVLLPKDWLRLELTGEMATDPSDAAGTLWLRHGTPAVVGPDARSVRADGGGDAARRGRVALHGHSASRRSLRPGDCLRRRLRSRRRRRQARRAPWRRRCPSSPGRRYLSMGTSGVVFSRHGTLRARSPEARRARVLPRDPRDLAPDVGDAQRGELPRVDGENDRRARDEADLLARVDGRSSGAELRSLSSVSLGRANARHNDPHARGVFFGMTHATTQAEMARAVLEGVAFAFADGVQALRDAGGSPRGNHGDRRRGAERALDADRRKCSGRDAARPRARRAWSGVRRGAGSPGWPSPEKPCATSATRRRSFVASIRTTRFASTTGKASRLTATCTHASGRRSRLRPRDGARRDQ